MSMYHVEIGLVATKYGTAEALDEKLDCILDYLVDTPGAVDPEYTASLALGDVEFSMSVDADNEPRALEKVLVMVRTAIHAAECATPGWEAEFKKVQMLIREAEAEVPELISA